MRLNEFFSKPINATSKVEDRNRDEEVDKDDLFWYIIDHDKLHKDYFFPIANKIKKLKECGPEMILELFTPMVEKGCKEYFKDKKLVGNLGKLFDKEMRQDLCQRLHDHYLDDIRKDKYTLGM
jgi:hypothetical protein